MKSHYLLFLPAAALTLGFIRHTTYSYFADSAASSTNTFSAAAVFPVPPTTTVLPPVINEVFNSANNNAEWIELYNPSSSPIDVSGWRIADGNSNDEFATPSAIPALGYTVITTLPSVVSGIDPGANIITVDGDIGSGLNGTSERITLYAPDLTPIDVVSYGSGAFNIFSTPVPVPSSLQSLIRQPNGVDTNSHLNWIVTTTLTPGSANP